MRPHWECKVCAAEPGPDGIVEHGKGCYQLHEDGGGSEYLGHEYEIEEFHPNDEPVVYFEIAKANPEDLGGGMYRYTLSSEDVDTLGTVTIPLGNVADPED